MIKTSLHTLIHGKNNLRYAVNRFSGALVLLSPDKTSSACWLKRWVITLWRYIRFDESTYACLTKIHDVFVAAFSIQPEGSLRAYIEHEDFESARTAFNNITYVRAFDTESQALFDKIRQFIQLYELAPKISAPVKPQGLQNIGNTCWMNAGLQFLAHTGALDHLLKEGALKESVEQGALQLQQLLRKITEQLRAHQPVDDSSLINLRKCLNDKFSPSETHDTHEFIAFLVSLLQEKTQRPNSHVISSTEFRVDQDLTTISDTLCGELFQVPIPDSYLQNPAQPIDINALLKAESNPGSTVDDYAHKEHRYNNVPKKTYYTYLPDRLTVHMKRRVHVPNSSHQETCNNPIQLGPDHTMILEYQGQPAKETVQVTYRVTGEVVYSPGHYTCNIKHKNSTTITTYNDEHASSCSSDTFGKYGTLLYLEKIP